jgi:hypothetical protein
MSAASVSKPATTRGDDFIHERRRAELLTVVTGVAIPEMDA